jgi:hypothetical protein
MLAGLHMRAAHCGLVDLVLRDPWRLCRARPGNVCVSDSVVLRVLRGTIEGVSTPKGQRMQLMEFR